MTYFGCQTGSSLQYIGPWTAWTGVGYACPGSGLQNVIELSMNCYIYSGSPTIRLAIYNSAGTTLIGQGSAAVTVTGASLTYQGHMTGAQCNNMQLTGGTTYLLVATIKTATQVAFGYDAAYPGGTTSYIQSGDYTGGFPGSITPTNTGSPYENQIRCGVTPAAVMNPFLPWNQLGPILAQ